MIQTDDPIPWGYGVGKTAKGLSVVVRKTVTYPIIHHHISLNVSGSSLGRFGFIPLQQKKSRALSKVLSETLPVPRDMGTLGKSVLCKNANGLITEGLPADRILDMV